MAVFGSAAKFPCLPNFPVNHGLWHRFFGSGESDSLLNQEEECARMHAWFKKTGVPSFVEPIEGFQVPVSAIIAATGVQETLEQEMVDIERSRLDELIFGSDGNERADGPYRLYTVT